jgi:hypothetical protein
MGLSFAELNLFTLEDFTTFTEVWVGDDKDAPRKATQDDINRFFG